jgi:hypothetical protein
MQRLKELIVNSTRRWDNCFPGADRLEVIMRALTLLILGLAATVVTAAQSSPTATNAPDIGVIETGWKREIYIPKLDDDPFKANNERDQVEADKKENERQNAVRLTRGDTPQPAPIKPRVSEGDSGGPTVNYVYKAKIQNTGPKTVKSIVWIFTLIDPETNTEVGHRRFINKVNIKPGKLVNLIGYSPGPASSVVQISKTDSTGVTKYIERIVVEHIDYADGSSWQQPANHP